jgi:uncharacterized SAM-binding protein YcdF (DUF218 family)
MRIGGFIILALLLFLSVLKGTVGTVVWVVLGFIAIGIIGYWCLGGRIIPKPRNAMDYPIKEDGKE